MKLLIVDDEKPARELLKSMLNKAGCAYEAKEATNGKIAFEIYTSFKPDLVITDIQMPVQDGLELIKNIRQDSPQQKIVVLSCHENFIYAKEALRLGVMDYLIKDSLSTEALLNLLLAVEQKPITQLVAPNALALALDPYTSIEKVTQRLTDDINDELNYFCCVAKGQASLVSSQSSLGAELEEFFSQNDGGHAYLAQDSLYVLIYMKKLISEMTAYNTRVQLVQKLRLILEVCSIAKPTIGISTASNSTASLRDQIKQASEACNSAVFLGKGRNIFYSKAQGQSSSVQIKALNCRMDNVAEYLSTRNIENLCQEINLLYSKELVGMLHYNYLQHINALLFGMLTRECVKNDVAYESVFGAEPVSMEEVNSYDNVEEMCDWYTQKYTALCHELSIAYSPRLVRVKAYLENNYHKDISLETVASEFGIHKVYLAKIFKTETGTSVNEYIRQLRIAKAKELIAKDILKIAEIIEHLGFNNPQSFYTAFKKETNMSPGEYKDKLKK